MVDIHSQLSYWMEQVDEAERKEIDELSCDPQALEDAFYRNLSFGTAGLRGIIGPGPNRMNIHTVGKATQGLADYLNAHFENPSVAIARDSRHCGKDFVEAAAAVLAANGVRAMLYSDIAPTPALSFAVRHLGCSAGINMTASHNPASYNGYKVYGPDGCQITSDAAAEIQGLIDGIDPFTDVRSMSFDAALEQGLAAWIAPDVLEAFLNAVLDQSQEVPGKAKTPLSIVYTPLNGTGLFCVKEILFRIGGIDVAYVSEQADPDGDFPTCPYPNPETRKALERGLALCEKTEPDLLLATDPDADRVGIAVRDEGTYALLTGNEVGILLFDFLCRRHRDDGYDLQGRVAVTTVVSSLMADAVAQAFGCELRRVLTGFKYIGEQIALLEQAGETDRFLFGYEESYGYLAGTHVRDKDAVVATMLIAQMARWYKERGMTLVDAMEGLYAEHGYYLNRTVNVEYPGSDGADKMDAIMAGLVSNPPQTIAGLPVVRCIDFSQGVAMPIVNPGGDLPMRLPAAKMVSFELGDGVQVLVRPSGTEPKIKAYLFSKAPSREEARALLDELNVGAEAFLS